MSENVLSDHYRTEEALTCLLCHHLFKDAVCLPCGHTYCKTCISATQRTRLCPKCQKKYQTRDIIPNYSIRHLISDFQQRKMELKDSLPVLVPLVHGDDNLQLDEYLIKGCFLQQEVKEVPLCLTCVIGAKGKGKSNLLNYILRALYYWEKGRSFNLEETEEPHRGDDWKADGENTPHALWMTNRPFMIQKNEENLVVFVLSMERTSDIDQETCVRLCAVLALLSSYTIFNISSRLSPADLEFLEMYLNISKSVGSFHSITDLQNLDLLVSNWNGPMKCGREASHIYIDSEAEKLKRSQQYNRVLQALRSPCVTAFLLPQTGLDAPEIGDRALLKHYISDLVNGISEHCKTDIQGQKMTCAQLGEMLKDFFILLQNTNYNFSSPEQVRTSLDHYQKRNEIIGEFREFLNTRWNLNSKTSSVKKRSLLEEYKASLQDLDEEKRQNLLDEMDSLMTKDMQSIKYSKYIKYLKQTRCALLWGMLGLGGWMLISSNLFAGQDSRSTGNVTLITRIFLSCCAIGASLQFFIGKYTDLFNKKE